jgi:hypothetical protein
MLVKVIIKKMDKELETKVSEQNKRLIIKYL